MALSLRENAAKLTQDPAKGGATYVPMIENSVATDVPLLLRFRCG
jgi:hypothetical protein